MSCVYFYSSWGSLSFSMWNDFQLKPGYFGHYVVNIWISHKLPGLVNFLWHCSIRGEGWHDLITARKEEKSSLPHLPATDIQGREGIFSTSRLRWEAPSFTQLWKYHCRWNSQECFTDALYVGSSSTNGLGFWWPLCYWVVVRVLVCLHGPLLMPPKWGEREKHCYHSGDNGSYLSAPDHHWLCVCRRRGRAWTCSCEWKSQLPPCTSDATPLWWSGAVVFPVIFISHGAVIV